MGVLSQVAAEPEERATFPAFRLEGQVQVQVDDGSLGTGRPNAGRPVRNGIGVFPSESRISPRRLRLKPRVEFTDSLTLYNQLDFDPDGFQQEDLELTVLDLYLSYQFAEGHELLIGQTKVPFGFENLRSSERLLTVERSDVMRQSFPRDIGAVVQGKRGRWNYSAGLFQGQGATNQERNGQQDYFGRVVYQAFPSVELGVAGHVGSFRPRNGGVDIEIKRLGLEARFQQGPFRLEGEYIVAQGYNLYSNGDTASRGFYIYGVYKAREDLEAVVGYDRYDPALGNENSLSSDNGANDRDRMTLGLNYYIGESDTHRVMLNYEIRRELEGPGASSNGLRFRYQFAW